MPKWRSEVPEDFVFAVKGGRFITHMKRLRDVEVPLANFFASGVLALDHTLGPILWQLPATFAYDEEVLGDFFDLLPRTTTEAAQLAATRHDEKLTGDKLWSGEVAERPLHYALEPDTTASPPTRRSRSYRVRRRAGRGRLGREVAAVRAGGRADWSTRGCTVTPSSTPAGTPTRRWTGGPTAARVDRGRTDAFVYFDNDMKGYAPHDALQADREARPNAGVRLPTATVGPARYRRVRCAA